MELPNLLTMLQSVIDLLECNRDVLMLQSVVMWMTHTGVIIICYGGESSTEITQKNFD